MCEQLPKLSFLTPLGTRTWCVGRPGGAAAPQGKAQSGARRRGKSGPENHSVPTLSSDKDGFKNTSLSIHPPHASNTHSHTHTHAHTRTDTYTYMHTHTHTHTSTGTRTRTSTHMHKNKHPRTHLRTRKLLHKHTYTHMLTSTHMFVPSGDLPVPYYLTCNCGSFRLFYWSEEEMAVEHPLSAHLETLVLSGQHCPEIGSAFRSST